MAANTYSEAIKTPEFRGSFVHLVEPEKFDDGKEGYGLTMVLPKDDPFWTKLQKAIDATAKTRFGSVPKAFNNPIKDGDEPNKKGVVRDEWAGCFHAKLKTSKFNLGTDLCDIDLEKITERSAIYSGAYYRAKLTVGVWDHPQNGKGASLYLDTVQKTKDGEAFGKTSSAAGDFADSVRDEDDDPMG